MMQLLLRIAGARRPLGWAVVLGMCLLLGLSAAPVAAQFAADEAEKLPILSSQPLGGKENALAVAVGDMDGDGTLDIVAGGGVPEAPGPNRIYFNDGAGRFSDRERLREFAQDALVRGLALGDVNGDGTLDIVLSNGLGPHRVYLNDGSGGVVGGSTFGSGGADLSAVALGDLDGDGYLDVAIVNACYTGDAAACEPNRVYFNDGQGRFDGTGSGLDLGTGEAQGAAAVALGDLDADGDLDVLVGHVGAASQIYLNDGQGGLRTASGLSPFGADAWTVGLAVGDVNGDGSLDVVEVNTGPDVVYLNDGAGVFQATQTLESDLYADTSAATLADVDGDGDLDLVAGGGNTEVLEEDLVLLNDGSGRFDDVLAFGSPNSTSSVAVAELNGDGVLDIVVANFQGAEVWVHLREAQGLVAPVHEFADATMASGLALGDVNGDGILDVVTVGGRDADNVVYLNDGSCLASASCPAYSFGSGGVSRSLALADLNGDDYLDVVEGNEGRNYFYLNPGVTPFAGFRHGVGFGSDQEDTRSVVVADLNGDGHLDIVAGNVGQNYIYFNDPQGEARFDRNAAARTFGASSHTTYSVATGDLDQDGHVDLVVGNGSGLRDGRYATAEQNWVYLNDGRGSFRVEQRLGRPDDTRSLALADLNGDRRLDVVVANSYSDRNQVYYNDGTGALVVGTPFGGFDSSRDVVVDDVDGDGDLDLILAGRREVMAFLNNGGRATFEQSLRLARDWSYGITAVRLGDLDGDGAPDLLVGRGDGHALANWLLLNRVRTTPGLANDAAYLTAGYPASTHPGDLTFSPRILESRYITVPFTLYDEASDAVGQVVASYSLDGGGRWLPAIAKEGTQTAGLAASPAGESHTFVWDTLATGVFGRSDTVVVRLDAYARPLRRAAAGTYLYPGRLPAPTQWPSAIATTRPFRLQGTQVQVIDQDGRLLEGAYVYRLPSGRYAGAQLMPDPVNPLATDARGLLPGRGVLAGGDRMVAMLPATPTHPITFTNQYHYYVTSAAPEEDGLAMTEVADTGLIQLTIPREPVTAVNPLLLFDLTVSTEWDATGDELFLLELAESFQLASEMLYDVSNGQVALGRIHLFPNKTFWNRADVVLYATNAMRPSAGIGGVVGLPVGEQVRPGYGLPATKLAPRAYVPGQVRMGTSWDPFGEDTSELGEQWWRALAHELAHHLLFLPDNYVGLKPDDPANPAGRRFLGRIDCQGSFMTTTRDPSYSEFLTEAEWLGECEESLAENTTGRTDWETITRFYPVLKAPQARAEGPSILPLAVTRLIPWQLPVSRAGLPARNFDLRDETGERVRLPNAQVYLFQTQNNDDPTDDVLVGLGSPTAGGDRIRVRGAVPGDRLCLFDFHSSDRTYAGCVESLSRAVVSIPVRALEEPAGAARWAPAMDVQALTTRTLEIRVSQPLEGGVALKAQVYPAHYPSVSGLAPTATLVLTDDGSYAGFVDLPYPASDVSVRIWADDGSDREAIAQFFLQLPWQPGERVVAGPDYPALSGGDYSALGGGDYSALGGGDYSALGGGDYSALGGGNYSALGGGDYSALGGGDYSALGGGDYSALGGGDYSALGGGDYSALGGGDYSALGGGDYSALGGGDYSALGGGDYSALGGGDYSVLGGGDYSVLGGGDYPVLGGGDYPAIGGGDYSALGGGDYPALGGAPRREFAAPILSADSQVVVYDQGGLFEPSGIRALQVLPTPPELDDEPWLVPVGQAYAVQPDEAITSTRTIAFNYLQRDVPEGYEHTLAIHFLPKGAATWQRLETRQFVENLVVADLQPGAGTYAVMSTVALPALKPGWNLLAYPLPDERAIARALRSIDGCYSVVYAPLPESMSLAALAPVAADAGNAGVMAWLASLRTNVETLEFGRVYLIKIEGDEPLIPYLAPPRRSPDGVVPGSH